MASAVIANDSSWKTTPSQPRAMGKLPFSNPKFSKKRQLHAPVVQAPPPLLDVDDCPAVTQSAASDDASSINRRPSVRTSEFNSYVTFNVRNYSRTELTELKRRLVTELEQIRQLKLRIESTAQIRSNIGPKSQTPNAKLGKKASQFSGNKRSLPKDVSLVKRVGGNHQESSVHLMKNCAQILSKLMRHKHGYIFNTPVDVVNLNLTDYFDIIKTPMDLGTIKTKLGKNLYDSPREFATDVRLTFNNAMRYNPKGHEVYILAEQQLRKFEELYEPIRVKSGDFDEDDVVEHQERQEKQLRDEIPQIEEVQASSWEKPANPVASNSITPSSGLLNQNVNSNPPQSNAQLPVRTPSPMRAPPVKPLKQPKPKAKDPNKRDMSLEEKHKLGIGLQNLPQEKMEQVVQIIRKRNGHLRQEGDEIELDIEAVDTETLWELDRFVTNYKKMVSKIKRQALINNAAAMAMSDGNKEVPGNDRVEVVNEVKKPKKGDAGEEDVDIGDEMPVSSFPPVEIEKDNGHASSSSSSSSSSSDDSSSSSDSDSGSSSGSDSEDAHS